MDNTCDCIWKNKKFPEECLNKKHKNEKCYCDLEPCPLYEKKNMKWRIKKWLNLKK